MIQDALTRREGYSSLLMAKWDHFVRDRHGVGLWEDAEDPARRPDRPVWPEEHIREHRFSLRRLEVEDRFGFTPVSEEAPWDPLEDAERPRIWKVVRVAPDSLAFLAGLREGMCITAVNGKEVGGLTAAQRDKTQSG